jgi:CspA family cold shock protein
MDPSTSGPNAVIGGVTLLKCEGSRRTSQSGIANHLPEFRRIVDGHRECFTYPYPIAFSLASGQAGSLSKSASTMYIAPADGRRRPDPECARIEGTVRPAWRVAGFKERTVRGTIRSLRVDKGFGFIKDEKGQEYFFHQSAIYGEGIADLREGDTVEFEVGQGPKGPRAENVRRTST